MTAPPDVDRPQDPAEASRRRLLRDSDTLLDQLEDLRLADRSGCPPVLATAVRALQVRLGSVDPRKPRTVNAAHQLVFAVQARLMAANPKNPHPRAALGRPGGQPRVADLAHGGAWKFLALPPPPTSQDAGHEADWDLLVQLTVERALDRWSRAQDDAVAAIRAGRRSAGSLQRARAAWRNYWELRCEAERLLSCRPAEAAGAAARR